MIILALLGVFLGFALLVGGMILAIECWDSKAAGRVGVGLAIAGFVILIGGVVCGFIDQSRHYAEVDRLIEECLARDGIPQYGTDRSGTPNSFHRCLDR